MCQWFSIPFNHVLFQPTLEPSTSIVSIHLIVDCLHIMSITRHASKELCNVDNNKIGIQVVYFLPMTFNRDILFEMPPLSPNNPSSL
jgi:hypothetical protein